MNTRDDSAIALLERNITDCERCPRLVQWRRQVARERRAAFADQSYWGRPVPGFGDPAARLMLLGLAPAAHGANRTGRMFTGDRSGDFLYAALWRAGIASQPCSSARGDGLQLSGAWVTAAVRCAPPANRPKPEERDQCMPWLERELELLGGVRVIMCLGAFAWAAAERLLDRSSPPGKPRRRRMRFGHGAELAGERISLIGCYHPSQQNTFTGRLTAEMIDGVLERARELAGLSLPA